MGAVCFFLLFVPLGCCLVDLWEPAGRNAGGIGVFGERAFIFWYVGNCRIAKTWKSFGKFVIEGAVDSEHK